MLTICLYVIGGVLCFHTSFSLPNSNRDLRFPNCRSDLLIATYCCRPSNRNILLMGCGKHYSNARFISQGEVAIGRSLLQGRCQERGRHWGKLASIGRYRGGVRRESPLGEVGIYGEVAIGRSLLQGRSGESRHWGKLALGRSRDREIAPTGEVSGESRHRGKLAFMERSRSGDRSYRGGVRRESPLGEVGIRGKSRSGDRSYRGGVRRESPLGEVGIYGESRDREIAPTGEVSGERVAIGGRAFMEVAIGRSLLQKT